MNYLIDFHTGDIIREATDADFSEARLDGLVYVGGFACRIVTLGVVA